MSFRFDFVSQFWSKHPLLFNEFNFNCRLRVKVVYKPPRYYDEAWAFGEDTSDGASLSPDIWNVGSASISPVVWNPLKRPLKVKAESAPDEKVEGARWKNGSRLRVSDTHAISRDTNGDGEGDVNGN